MALFPHHRVTHCSRFESITKNPLDFNAKSRSDSRRQRVSSCCVLAVVVLHYLSKTTALRQGICKATTQECWPYFSVAGDQQGCDFNSVEIDGIRNNRQQKSHFCGVALMNNLNELRSV